MSELGDICVVANSTAPEGGNVKVLVRQTRSNIRKDKGQLLYLKSLGLRGIGSEKELVLSDSVKSLLVKVSHLVSIIR
jgi:ribosomal protein L30/L7E